MNFLKIVQNINDELPEIFYVDDYYNCQLMYSCTGFVESISLYLLGNEIILFCSENESFENEEKLKLFLKEQIQNLIDVLVEFKHHI